jgi:hypothetical protein
MIKATFSTAVQNTAAQFLTKDVNEGLQWILMYIAEIEDKHTPVADHMKQVLACLCAQITPEQALD